MAQGTRRGSGRRGAAALVVALLLLVAAGIAWWWLAVHGTRPEGQPTDDVSAAPADDAAGGAREPPVVRHRPRRRADPGAQRQVATNLDDAPADRRGEATEDVPDPAPGPGAWTVTDRTGLPVVGTAVELRADDDDAVRLLRTDDEGRIWAGDALPARTRVRIAATGYDVLDVAAGDVVDRVLRLHAVGRISGSVVDDAGRAVRGAEVVARPDGMVGDDAVSARTGAGPWFWRATTGPGGSFVFEGVPPRAMTVAVGVRATGFRPAGRAEVTGVTAPAEDVVLRLGAWPIVTGRVLDAAGQPIENANVALRARRPDGSAGRSSSTKTTKDGRFVIEDVTPGNTLWAWSGANAGLAMAVLTDVVPGAGPLEIRLVPGGPIVARVVDAAGQPFTGSATFYVLRADGHVHNSANVANGRVRTHVLAFDTRYDLLVYGAGGRSGRLDDVHAGASELVVQLRPVAPIRGRVLGPDGAPAAAGMRVRAVAVPMSAYSRPGITLVAKTDSLGGFSLGEIADLPFAIWAEPVSGGAGAAPSAVAVGVLPGSDVTLRLRRGVAVSGRLSTGSDGPASPRTLWLVPGGGLPWHVETPTGADGRFDVQGLAPGAYTVWLQVPPNRTVRLGVLRAPSADVELTLPPR